MGVALYKPGDKHTINGILCDMEVFNEDSFLHNLKNGWFFSPEECYAKREVEMETEEPEKEEGLALNSNPMPDEDIRAAAKEAGISHWHNKSIARLKDELKNV